MTADIAKVHDIQWYADVPRSIGKQTMAGLFLMLATFGGFGTWAFSAPLAAAIISQGSFVATGQNKVVQHFGGGIIKELLVEEGEQVVAGQPLVYLDETTALADERQLFLRRARLEAIVARLNAEMKGSSAIEYPLFITESAADPDVAAIMESQQTNIESSLAKMNSEIGLLAQNVDSFAFRIEGYEQQLESVRRQMAIMKDEYAGKDALYKQGLLRKTELMVIQRALAEADGQIGRLTSEISETDAQRTKVEQQIDQARNAYRQAALDEMQAVEGELDNVREKFLQAKDVLRRTTINAPVSGTIVRLYYHTAGGVIENGKPILEILPSDVPLIIEAQVLRSDIDQVKVGQHATVRLVSLNQRTTPVLNGRVYYISADSLPDGSPMNQREVYIARIDLSASELARVPGFMPSPGMPAEVLIQTAERTFFSYITKPISDSMARSFMEQ